jgi:hypothetical protein
MSDSNAKKYKSSITKSELALMLGYSTQTLRKNLKSIGINNRSNYLHPNDLKLFDEEFGLPDPLMIVKDS